MASVWKRSFATPGTGSGAEPGVRHSLHRGGRGICIVGSSNLASYPGPGYEARSKYTSPVDRGVSTTAREKNMKNMFDIVEAQESSTFSSYQPTSAG